VRLVHHFHHAGRMARDDGAQVGTAEQFVEGLDGEHVRLSIARAHRHPPHLQGNRIALAVQEEGERVHGPLDGPAGHPGGAHDGGGEDGGVVVCETVDLVQLVHRQGRGHCHMIVGPRPPVRDVVVDAGPVHGDDGP